MNIAQHPDKNEAPAKGHGAAPLKRKGQIYLTSLVLANIRCFGPRQELSLVANNEPARWTIVLGLNGSGKSTLLQSLAGFEIVRTERKPISHWPRFLTKSTNIRQFIRSENEASEITATGVIADSLGSSSSSKFEIKLFYNGSSTSVNYEPEQLEQSSLHLFGYGATRRFGSISLSSPSSVDCTDTLFSDEAVLRNPEEWLLQLDYASARAPNDKQARHRLSQAKELLLSVMPDDEVTDIRLITSKGPIPNPHAEFLTPYGWVPLRQLGYGYQTLITWVADLANRMAESYPDSKNPLVEPAVVLVDEIDLHLHPQWQRKLMTYLTARFPNTQFIATAHSPLVAQAAGDANLVVLRRESDHVAIDNEVDNIRNWRIDQILTSDLFGLKTARPPQIEALLEEREKLLEKTRLSGPEKRRLGELNAFIDDLPFGETAQDRNERETIKKAVHALMKERKPVS